MDAYRDESRAIFQRIRSTGVEVEQVSVDEAYLEATRLFAPDPMHPDAALEAALPFARELKDRIRSERGLTASIGVASGTEVRYDLRALTGSFGPTLKQFAFGIDDRPLELGDDIKSISSENTFPRDTADRPTLRRCLREQADEIAAKLQRRRLAARTVQVKVRYGDFSTLTRQVSVEDPVTDPRDLYRLGCWLLGRENLVHRPLRLLGLGASGLLEVRSIQLPLPFPRTTTETHSS